MAQIHEKIKEIEDALLTLIKKAAPLSPDRLGIIQQKAIRSFKKTLRGLQGWQLGELKNAFGMGDGKDLTDKVKKEVKQRGT